MANFAEVTYIDVTISSSGTDSTEADLSNGRTLVGVIMPATFTGVALTFSVSDASGGTYNVLYGTDGNAYSYTVAAARHIALDPAVFAGVRYLKVISGSTELGARTVRLVVRNV